jgi:hypothetical protein
MSETERSMLDDEIVALDPEDDEEEDELAGD